MAHIGNSPTSETVLRLEARKSFALGLYIQDANGRPLDITDASIRLVAKKLPLRATDTNDADNLILNSEAELVTPESGFARFNIQASDTNHKPGEYAYTVVLTSEGYSSVLFRGTLDLRENTEFSSVDSSYVPGVEVMNLQLKLSGPKTIVVQAGAALPPGTTSFTDDDKTKLDSIELGAQVNDPNQIPRGGSRRAYLGKRSPVDFDLAWFQPPQTDPSGLDAEGISAGRVPTANGAGGWDWAQGVASADDISDGTFNVMMTTAERDKLTGLTRDYTLLDNLPILGGIASHNVDEFLQPNGVDGADITTGTVSKDRLPKVSAHNGFTSGTDGPSGGADGDIYFQYTV